MKPEELIKNAQDVLKNEYGEIDVHKKEGIEFIKEYLISGMNNTKDILSPLYAYQTRQRLGFFGKLKSLIQNKIVFTAINVFERPGIKQQKFNELTYQTIVKLTEEIEELRAKIKDSANS
jgi:hypothetical protein